MFVQKRYYFILTVMMGMIVRAAYAGEAIVPEPAQSVAALGAEAVFAAGTNDLSDWGSETTPRKYRLTVIDGAGKKAAGYVGAVGGKEELGPELFFDGELELFTKKGRLSSLGWTRDRCAAVKETESLRPGTAGRAAVKVTVVNGKTRWGNSGLLFENIPIEYDRLYKLSGWVKNGAGSNSVFLTLWNKAPGTITAPVRRELNGWKECVLYFALPRIQNAPPQAHLCLTVNDADGAYGYGDDISFREVVSGGGNTARIYLAREGNRQGWEKIETGFNPFRVSKCVIEEAK